MKKLEGRCLCGAIRYESKDKPKRMVASDCRHCRKQAGVALSLSLGVATQSLDLHGLAPTVYVDSRPSGIVVLRSFCPRCGVPLFTESDIEPGIVFINAATLDDAPSIDLVEDQKQVEQFDQGGPPGAPAIPH